MSFLRLGHCLRRFSGRFLIVSFCAPVSFAAAQQNVLQLPGVSVRSESTPVTILLILTFLTLIPAILLSMTPFVAFSSSSISCARRWARKQLPPTRPSSAFPFS